jgi:hypothetical protein
MPTGEIHDVVTPVSTPVPEEVIKEEKPISPPPQTPRMEVVVPKVQVNIILVVAVNVKTNIKSYRWKMALRMGLSMDEDFSFQWATNNQS